MHWPVFISARHAAVHGFFTTTAGFFWIKFWKSRETDVKECEMYETDVEKCEMYETEVKYVKLILSESFQHSSLNLT